MAGKVTGDPLMEDFCDQVAHDLARGRILFSCIEPRAVKAVRYLVEECKMTADRVSERLRLGKTRGAVIGLCTRARPKIQFARKKTPGRPPAGVDITVPERRQMDRKPRNSGNTLSTHHVRLMKKIEDVRPKGRGAMAAAGKAYHAVNKINEDRAVNASEGLPQVEPPNAIASRIAVRRMMEPTCCWAGCNNPTPANVPYCQEHGGSGKMITTWR